MTDMVDLDAVTDGVISFLASEQVGEATQGTEVFSGVLPALVAGPLPAFPDRAIGVTVYGYEVSPDPNNPMTVVYLQVVSRGVPDGGAPHLISSRVAEGLHALHHVTLGTVKVQRVALQSTGPLGRDSSGRLEWVDNYRMVFNGPSA